MTSLVDIISYSHITSHITHLGLCTFVEHVDERGTKKAWTQIETGNVGNVFSGK